MTMIGFPPALTARWSLSNWQNAPYNRWSFQHLREVVPTARVGRGPAVARPLPVGAQFDEQQVARRFDGSAGSVAEVLADTYTDGFLALHDGKIVAEQYPTGMAPDCTHMLMSVSKSLVGCVVGVLADRGDIDVATAVDFYVPELAHSGYRGATVQDVLDMRSGIGFSEEYLDPTSEVRTLEEVIGWAPRSRSGLPTSMYEYLATLTASRAHGGPFDYRSCETDILGWVCERVSGVRMPELLSTLIWSRIGAEQDMDASVDQAGAVFHDGGLAATLRDVGRFGQLLLDDGAIGGDQVISASWIADSHTGGPDSLDAFSASGNDYWLPGGRYRNQFWIPYAGRDVMLCIGIHGQLVWIEPSRRLVVVKLSSWPLPQDVAKLLDTFAAIDRIGFQLTPG